MRPNLVGLKPPTLPPPGRIARRRFEPPRPVLRLEDPPLGRGRSNARIELQVAIRGKFAHRPDDARPEASVVVAEQ